MSITRIASTSGAGKRSSYQILDSISALLLFQVIITVQQFIEPHTLYHMWDFSYLHIHTL